MNSYNMYSYNITDEKIYITIDKIFSPNDQNVELDLESINASVSSLPMIDDINMTQNSVAFHGHEIDGFDIGKGIYHLKSACYELPTDPFLAFHTIILLDDYVMKTKCEYKNFNFKTHINNGICNTAMDDLFGLGYVTNEEVFEKKHPLYNNMLTQMKNLKNYQPILCKLKDFYNFCQVAKMPLLECINNTTLSQLIWENKSPYDLLNDNLDPVKRLEIVNEITGCAVNTNNKWEIAAHNAAGLLGLDPTDWNKIIQNILREKLINLCAPCDGKIAYDKKPFNMKSLGHTEVQFIVDCGLNLTLQNNKICLTNIRENPSYKKHYVPGESYYEDFEVELITLGEYIGLEFEVCNRDEIVFTKETCDFLEKNGLVSLIELSNYFKKSPESLVIVNKDYKEPQVTVSNVKGTLFVENSSNPNNATMQDANQASLSNTNTLTP